MKLFRHLGLMIAVFWCAAMIVIPLAAAADAGCGINQGMNQPGSPGMEEGQAGPGNNQMQNGPGQAAQSGGSLNLQEDVRNNAGPGQGNRPGGSWNMTLQGNQPGCSPVNGTAFGNHMLFRPDDGNLTPPAEKPEWDPANVTAMNNTRWHGHGNGNITDIPAPMDQDPANMTAVNTTGWHSHADVNRTVPVQPPVQGNGQGLQGRQPVPDQQESGNDMNSPGEFLAQLVSWLKANAGS